MKPPSSHNKCPITKQILEKLLDDLGKLSGSMSMDLRDEQMAKQIDELISYFLIHAQIQLICLNNLSEYKKETSTRK